MGRLVYVREDREAEPRFSNPGSSRGGFEGGAGGRGNFQGNNFGGPPGGGAGGRQVYVANVRISLTLFHMRLMITHVLTQTYSFLTT